VEGENGDTDDFGISELFNDFGRIDVPCQVELNAMNTPAGKVASLQWNMALTKDFSCAIPKPVVIVVHINGQPACMLVNTGSLADFMSLNLAEQLRVKKIPLEKPLTIQLAVQGSRSKVNYGVMARLQYQEIDHERYFNVINLQNYDLILGTPFLYQHKVMVGLNSPRIVIGSRDPVEMKGPQVSVLELCAAEVFGESLERARIHLHELAKLLCSQAGATALPPLRAINHAIPLIDEKKVYPWRPS
jgi:Retroviral aspartyl protease